MQKPIEHYQILGHSNQLKIVGTLTRAIKRQLWNVETLPTEEAAIELPDVILNTNEDEKEF